MLKNVKTISIILLLIIILTGCSWLKKDGKQSPAVQQSTEKQQGVGEGKQILLEQKDDNDNQEIQKIITAGEWYDGIFSWKINGKPVFRFEDGNKNFFVYDNYRSKKYDHILLNNDFSFGIMNGKIYYIASDSDSRFIVYGDREIGKNEKFDYIENYTVEPSKKLTFLAGKQGKKPFLISIDDEKIDIKEYDFIAGQREVIDNKLAFLVEKDGKKFIIYGDLEIGKEYDSVGQPLGNISKLTFMATKNNKNFVVYGDQKIGENYKFAISSALEFNNKLALIVQDNDSQFVIYDNQEIGREAKYKSIKFLAKINNQLSFIAEKRLNAEKTKFVIVSGNQEFGEYDFAWFIASSLVGDEGVFQAVKDDKNFIFYGGKEIGGEYDNVNFIAKSSNKLIFTAVKDEKTFIVYNNTEIGKNYDSIRFPKLINNKLFFIAKKDGEEFAVYDGQELGKNKGYMVIDSDFVIDNKLGFQALVKDGRSLFFYDGYEFGGNYTSISNPTIINNHLVFLAGENGKTFIVYDNKEIGKEEYDRVFSPMEFNNKLVFIVRKDNKSSLVAMDFSQIDELKEPLKDQLVPVKPVNNDIVITAMSYDSQRVNDVKQMSSILEMEQSDNPKTFLTGCTDAYDLTNKCDNFGDIKNVFPSFVDPSKSTVACNKNSASSCAYSISRSDGNAGALTNNYQICFYLEVGSNNLKPGLNSIVAGVFKSGCK